MKKIIGFVGAFGMATPGMAADTYFGLTAEVGAGYDSNPYLRQGGGGSASVNGNLTPTFQIVTPTSTTALSGYIGRVEYLQKNRNPAKSYRANLDHTQRLSSTLTATAGVSASETTTSLLDPINEDVTTSSDRRRRFYEADGSLSWQQDARNSWSASGYVNKAEYPGARTDTLLRNYKSYGGSVAYRRLLSERTTIGVSVNGSRINSTSYPDTTSFRPQITFSQMLSSVWRLDGGIGAIFQKTSYLGNSSKSTNLGFNFDLCGTYPVQTFCFTGSRDTAPSGFGGARTRTNIGVTYDRKLSERSSINASASYVRDKSPAFLQSLARSIDYQDASLRYSHQLSERLSAGVEGNYRRRSIKSQGSADSFGGVIFLSMSFGHLKP